MRYLLVPDKFKGSLTSKEVIRSLKKGILKFDSKAEFKSYIISDGGEGFLQSLELLLELKKVKIKSKNSLLSPISSYYMIDEKMNRAYIELAKSSGLIIVKSNLDRTNSYVF